MKKSFCFISVFLFFINCFFSQSNAENLSNEEEINLPEVSTIISGGAPKVGKSAVPDYSEILPERQTSEVVPKLKDASVGERNIEEQEKEALQKSKTVYADGSAGVGLPNYFTGKFSIYRETGNSPFKLSFGHESLNGFARNSEASGFFEKNTEILVDKKYSSEKIKWEANGIYNSIDTGLQNQDENISDITKQTMALKGKISVPLSKGFNFNSNLNANWYKRFATIVGEPVSEIPDYAEKISVFNICPELKFGYEKSGFYFDLEAGYKLSVDAAASFEESNISRGNFNALFGFKNDFVNAALKGGIIVGNQIGDNSVVVPFNLNADFLIPVSFSNRKIGLNVSGGIDSTLPEISMLEEKNKFSSIMLLPDEVTDWFGKIDFSLPIKDLVTTKLSAEFRRTAFSNGMWTVDYENEKCFMYGQYIYEKNDTTQLNTELSCAFSYKLLSVSAMWKSYWIDLPFWDYRQFIKMSLSIHSPKSRIVSNVDFGFSPDSNQDNLPVIDVDFTVKLTDSVRLALTASDIVKLISGESRIYSEKYIRKSGYAGILVKFFF